MNKDHLQQIIDNYISRFEELNGPVHMEYYKWRIMKRFRLMMDEALAAPDDEFSAKLYEAKKLSANVIDSYTQPFNGLVEFAKKEPYTVRTMFRDLLQTADADVSVKQTAIQTFLDMSHQLRAKYFPDSYLYNDDLHSVTGYLFLYDPDHNYLYKATHCRSFADCVEFYDDWGSGEGTRLDVFFRMCDEVLEAIRTNEALMVTAASRYAIDPDGMHPDTEKHILLFDLIYCCSTYGLFKGISYVVPKTGERKLMQDRKEKAQALAAELEDAKAQLALLDEAKAYLAEAFAEGTKIRHRTFGEGVVQDLSGTNITAQFAKSGQKTLDIIACVINNLISVEDEAVSEKLQGYHDVLAKDHQIRNAVSWAEKALAPYADYL